MFKNILLGIDGSEHALRVAKVAGDLARAMKSKTLWIVIAYDPIPAYLGQPNMQHAITGRLQEAESHLNMAIEAVGKIPGEIRREMLEGSPADEIIKVAELRKSDLIIMGSRWAGGVSEPGAGQPVSDSDQPCALSRAGRSLKGVSDVDEKIFSRWENLPGHVHLAGAGAGQGRPFVRGFYRMGEIAKGNDTTRRWQLFDYDFPHGRTRLSFSLPAGWWSLGK